MDLLQELAAPEYDAYQYARAACRELFGKVAPLANTFGLKLSIGEDELLHLFVDSEDGRRVVFMIQPDGCTVEYLALRGPTIERREKRLATDLPVEHLMAWLARLTRE